MRSLLVIASILVLGVDNIEVQEECSSAEGEEGSRHCYKTKKTSCEGKLKLKNLLQQNLGENNIFFIESSPKEVVTPREACTLESAARNSGLNIVMVRAGQSLDLSDNTTCQLVNMNDQFGEAINIYYVDFSSLAAGTSLEGFFESERLLRQSINKFVHMADAVRLLLLYRYGGFYSDTDMIILRDLTNLHNVVASDQVTEIMYTEDGHRIVGNKISNAMLHMDKGQNLVKCCMDNFKQAFTPRDWAAAGPDLIHRCFLNQCGFPNSRLQQIPLTEERFSSDSCDGVSVVSDKSFYPVSWLQKSLLWEGRTKKDWDKMFDGSYSVHFYHGSSNLHTGENSWKIKRPQYYGARKPAYLSLALEHCPVSFYSQPAF